MKPDDLSRDLAQLRRQPGVDLATMRRVDDVIGRHVGQRLTVGRGAAAADRLAQARAIVSAGTDRAESVRRIMGGLGMSRSSAYRYWALVCSDAQQKQAS